MHWLPSTVSRLPAGAMASGAMVRGAMAPAAVGPVRVAVAKAAETGLPGSIPLHDPAVLHPSWPSSPSLRKI